MRQSTLLSHRSFHFRQELSFVSVFVSLYGCATGSPSTLLRRSRQELSAFCFVHRFKLVLSLVSGESPNILHRTVEDALAVRDWHPEASISREGIPDREGGPSSCITPLHWPSLNSKSKSGCFTSKENGSAYLVCRLPAFFLTCGLCL